LLALKGLTGLQRLSWPFEAQLTFEGSAGLQGLAGLQRLSWPFEAQLAFEGLAGLLKA